MLTKNGSIYLVENDIGGEFEEIRNRYPDISRTKKYNDWIESNNFKVEKFIENNRNRCYHCKKEVFKIVKEISSKMI